MKTKNNVQKTTLAATAIFAFIFITFLASASESNFKNINAGSPALRDVTEGRLEVEGWMLNENFFAANNFDLNTTEKPLEIEPWMIEENYFNAASLSEPVYEQHMMIENWMSDEANFIPAGFFEQATDKSMIVEDWMIRNIYW